MKISLNWLQDFIEITEKNNDKIKSVITANTAEIETMERVGGHLENIVVGKIEKLWAHPNADALKLCSVSDGKETFQVVCGGSNLREGMKVAFGRLGAVVRWHGTEVMKLEKVKIRGEESFGMICASDEIGLAEMFPKKSEKEIIDLSHLEAKPGTLLSKVLGFDDMLIDIDNHALTNRWDLFSHLGFAREFVANGLGRWKKSKAFSMPQNKSLLPIEIEVLRETCPRYMGVVLEDIKVGESPEWLKKKLTTLGIRPISNIVDVTNVVMMELGVPNHAFDLDQVRGKKWTMRKARKGEKVITLDEKTISLTEDMLVFDEGGNLFDFCGIMGGLSSGINSKTNRLWLHVPIYDPKTIRRGARLSGQVTDAAIIYEKGVDPEMAPKALERLVELFIQVSPGATVASQVLDVWSKKRGKRELNLTSARLECLVGCKISAPRVKKILNDLGFTVKQQKGGWKVNVPSWRMNDIQMENDLIEEVARIYGYDNIPFTPPARDLTPVSPSKRRVVEREVKEKLVALGFDEICTFAFLGPELLKKCGLESNDKTIEIANPISADISLMRQSLLPRTLETIEQIWRHEKQFRLFELSKTYFKEGNESRERSALIMSMVGEDFRTLQGVIEAFGLTVEHVTGKTETFAHHPGRRAVLTVRGQKVGWLYEVHPLVLKNLDIKTPVMVSELDMEKIHEMDLARRCEFKELPRFPSVMRDVSIAIPARELAARYFDLIAKTDKTLIRDIDLIDEYTGEKVEQSHRALTYSITYRADDRTLTEEEVNVIHGNVITTLKNNGAMVR